MNIDMHPADYENERQRWPLDYPAGQGAVGERDPFLHPDNRRSLARQTALSLLWSVVATIVAVLFVVALAIWKFTQTAAPF